MSSLVVPGNDPVKEYFFLVKQKDNSEVANNSYRLTGDYRFCWY
jgi:hypothetical protein